MSVQPSENPLPQLEGYELIRLMSRGGEGEVYEATGPDGGRVVVKLYFGRDDSLAKTRERIDRELAVLGALDCEHVVSAHDGGPAKASLDKGYEAWMAMDHLDGVTLKRRLRDRGPVTDETEFCTLLAQLLCGVAAIHDTGALHRDLKPGNIVVEQRGGRSHVTVIDFGVAVAFAGPVTRFVGAGCYVAPQQRAGHPSSQADDIYSVWAIAYAMLTGRPGEVPIRDERTPVPAVAGLSGVPSWAYRYEALLARAGAPAREDRVEAQQLLIDLVGLGWPAGAPAHITRLLTHSTLAEEQQTVVELVDSLTWASNGPSAQIFDLDAYRVASGPEADEVAPGLLRAAVRALWSDDADARWLRAAGRLLARAGRRQEADQAYQRAAERDDPVALLRVALADPAPARWRRAARAGSSVAQYGQAIVAYDRGDRATADGLLEAAARRGDALAARALVDLRAAGTDAAAAERARRLAVAVGDPITGTEQAARLITEGRVSDAERLLFDAADRHGHPEAMRDLARLHMRQRYPARAIELFEQAIACGLDDADVSIELGRALWDDDQKAKAKATLWMADSPKAKGTIGLLRYQDGEPQLKDVAGWLRDGTGEPSIDTHTPLAFLQVEMGDGRAALATLAAAPSTNDITTRMRRQMALLAASGILSVPLAEIRAHAEMLRDQLNQANPQKRDLAAVARALHELPAELAAVRFLSAQLARFEAGDPTLVRDDPSTARPDLAERFEGVETPRALSWQAYFLGQDSPERRAVLQKAAALGETFAMRELDAVGEGLRNQWLESAIALNDNSARVTLANRVWEQDPERALTLLRKADANHHDCGSLVLGQRLRDTQGARHPDVVAAFSRAELYGSSNAIGDISIIVLATDGPSAFVRSLRERDAAKIPRGGGQRLALYLRDVEKSEKAEAAALASVKHGNLSAWTIIGAIREGNEDYDGALEAYRTAPEDWTDRWLFEGLLYLTRLPKDGPAEAKAHRQHGLDCLRRADSLGQARGAYYLAKHLDSGREAREALERAADRISDSTKEQWRLTIDREGLRRQIEELRTTLPKIA